MNADKHRYNEDYTTKLPMRWPIF